MKSDQQLRWRQWAAGLCLLLAGVAAALWWARPRALYNVLLVTLDTTRADHIGCYGYSAAKTPTLDALAADGVVFENAYATVPLTLPAHASILTGLYPPENGLHVNGQGRLDPSLPNLADVLHREGYSTGAFIASVVLHSKYGLDHGFDVYDDDMAGGEQHGHESHLMRNADLVVDRALTWLRRQQDRPFFCWVHLFDPHAPYEGHAEVFGNRFRDQPYDGDIAFADLHIGRLIAHLRERGAYERTLIVVVGDHGEGLGEHAEQEHGVMLYNSTVRVPLIVSCPDLCRAGQRVATPVSQVDLLPTVLDCLEIAADETARVSGATLRGALQGASLEPRDLYCETMSVYEAFGWAPLTGVITETWKYVNTTREELYNLREDSGEMNNLAESQPAVLQEMQQLLARVQQQMKSHATQAVHLTESERKKLESLGYLSGSNASSQKDGATLPDVKDMMLHYNAEIEARMLISDGQIGEAIERLRDVIQAAPKFIPARMTLGTALQQQGRPEDAIDVFHAAIEADSDASAPHFELGKYFAASGETEKAIEHYRAALRLNPRDATSHFNLGSLLFSQGDFKTAREHYELGLAEFPDSTVGQFNFSVLLASQGELDLASEHARRAAELSPQNPQIRLQLGKLYVSQGNLQAAVVQFEHMLRLNPNDSRAAEYLDQARQALMDR